MYDNACDHDEAPPRSWVCVWRQPAYWIEPHQSILNHYPGQKRSGTRRLLGAIYTEGDNFVDEYVEHGSGNFDAEVRDFAAAIRGAQPPDVSPEDALTFMKLLDAIYLSAQTGEKVQVAE